MDLLFSEKRHCFGGVETAIRCTDAALLAELCAPYEAHASAGRAPEVIVEYAVDPGVDREPFVSGRERLLPAVDASGTARFRGPAERHCVDVALRLSLLVALPGLGGLILHGAGVADPRGAVLFTGPSGAGKSTIFRLLAESGRFPDLLADELLFLRREPAGWRVFATPFGGERRSAPQASAKVRALYVLRKAPQHRALPLSRPAALAAILPQVRLYAGSRRAAEEVLDLAARLVAELPCFTLEFAKDPGVVIALEEP